MSDTHQTIDLGPGLFASSDRTVINWDGAHYYAACGAYVSALKEGGQSHCVKPHNHGGLHEDMAGRTKDELDLELGDFDLEGAVHKALAAAGGVWEDYPWGTTFDRKLQSIYNQLVHRIHAAGPIYG